MCERGQMRLGAVLIVLVTLIEMRFFLPLLRDDLHTAAVMFSSSSAQTVERYNHQESMSGLRDSLTKLHDPAMLPARVPGAENVEERLAQVEMRLAETKRKQTQKKREPIIVVRRGRTPLLLDQMRCWLGSFAKRRPRHSDLVI